MLLERHQHAVKHLAAVVEGDRINDLAEHAFELGALEGQGPHRREFGRARKILRRDAEQLEAAGAGQQLGMVALVAGQRDRGVFEVAHQRQQPFGGNGGRAGCRHFGFDPGGDADFQIRGGQADHAVAGFDQHVAENRQRIAAADGADDPLQRLQKFLTVDCKFHRCSPCPNRITFPVVDLATM
ncbi:hypothetical protein SDC9_78031 [bioreactor metagenome]|uniref:Uncharacterized protein n=1 Tax=bioreactor metagenome TaxID=1076179 RepID=A0A644YSI7_9ZZZZ